MKLMSTLILLLFIILPQQSPALTGEEVASLNQKAQEGYVDSDVYLELETINSSGKKKRKQIHISQKEHITLSDTISGEASLIIFSPQNCAKSMAILTIESDESAIRQWMFLPALKKVRTISADSRGGALAGSEFSYEELTGHSASDYEYDAQVETITYNGHKTWQFDRYPKNKNSQYSQERVLLDSSMHLPHKIDYYDHKGGLSKTLTFEGYHDVGETRHFRSATMTNHQNKNHSVVTILEDNSNTGLSKERFDPQYLKDEMVKNRCIR